MYENRADIDKKSQMFTTLHSKNYFICFIYFAMLGKRGTNGATPSTVLNLEQGHILFFRNHTFNVKDLRVLL